ncbi:MAG: tRNA 2-thiocytidine biosynthesis TtcA family protein, partial [Clostridia bacterium]
MDDQRLFGMVRKGIEDFNLIDDNDKIAVGVSGGKDSLTLLYALANIQKFLPKHFELEAIMIDLGFAETDQNKVAEVAQFCQSLNVKLHIVKTEISTIVFDLRKEKNPCSLCANMRRGSLNKKAKELGCNKVALAHSADDFVETFLMSLIFE